MRLIDSKGRLFGKINVIDFAVVLFIVVLIPIYFIGSKIINAQKRVDAVVELSTVLAEVKFTNIIPELANVFKEGDLARDEGDKPIGKLLKIISNEKQKLLAINVSLDGDRFRFAPDSSYREIKALLELKCEQKGRVFNYNGSAVKIGNPLTFSTDLYSIEGTIIDVKR